MLNKISFNTAINIISVYGSCISVMTSMVCYRLEGKYAVTALLIAYLLLLIAYSTKREKIIKGRWVDLGANEYWCNQCNGIVVINNAKDFPYCPYCGAKMEDK